MNKRHDDKQQTPQTGQVIKFKVDIGNIMIFQVFNMSQSSVPSTI